MTKLKNKKIIIFDLDGTLTESKSNLDSEMSKLLCELLNYKKVAIIGGGKYEQFKNQFLKNFKCDAKKLKNLFLFPTNATAFYKFKNNKWRKIYEFELKRSEVQKIFDAFNETFKKFNYSHPEKTYGPVIENRGTQITFSALGQEVVSRLGNQGLKLKENWLKKNKKLREQMAKYLQKLLPEFEIRVGGLTSIDATKKGIDKAFGVSQISKNLKTSIKDMAFVGDALFPGGNDYSAKKTGILCIQVKSPEETKELIRKIIK
jgi:HAD superfamily hydrolase (TIGR01484 family)